ncbi:ExeM/NucH family extracellular endonuclease [Marinobacter halotolerans]|uniref:ExeM/NucH family extracellular endonuclease n=1 Tax=Marinobacter halotolerans TaxID=1569211 RepID=UPI001CD940A6|nr:ExeM/NucH family extracellular endonuclease [Marinobacter halotolerans]
MTGLLAGALLLSGDLHARCGADALPVSEVQGGGDSSPLSGSTVTVEGVITLDSREPNGWRGFYLQQADSQADNSPQTSEALFIYTDRAGGAIGTRVRVTGQVKEYHGLTELTRVSELTVCGPTPLPEPTTIELPWPGQQPPEHLENMRVVLRQPLTLIGHYSFERYGELILADQPQVTPTEILPPGPDAETMTSQQALNRLYLDDGLSKRNPDPLPWPASLLTSGTPVRAGDRIAGLTGILDFRFGQWRLQPARQPSYLEQNPRPKAPERSPSITLRVVTLNLGNFFNGDGNGKGFADSRGARNQSELAAQKSRLVATLTALDPDVIATAEMENDDYGPASAIAELATALGPNWQFVATPGATGTDAIRTDLLYRADRVRTVAEPRRFDHGLFRYRGRPPIAQLFQPLAGDRQKIVRIVVPHLKSKACGGASGADRDQGDGQGCYARRRTDAASALADWLATLPEPEQTQGEFAGTLVTGDLNSYAREWPIQRLESAGLTNLVRRHHECRRDDCPQSSYQYQGRKGSLDYSLGSKPLLGQVVGAGVWPVNAAEFPVINYQGRLAAPIGTPWRSSDHNPLYTDLAL